MSQPRARSGGFGESSPPCFTRCGTRARALPKSTQRATTVAAAGGRVGSPRLPEHLHAVGGVPVIPEPGVGAEAAGEEVAFVVAFAVQDVVAVFAVERVAAGAAEQGVVAAAAVEEVVAAVAAEEV